MALFNRSVPALILALATLVPLPTFAQPTHCASLFSNSVRINLERVEDQVAMMRSMIVETETQYGQRLYKEVFLGVKTRELLTKYERIIREQTPDQEAFEQLMIQLAAEFEDGHMNIVRNSEKYWTTGILAAGVEGRLLVTGEDLDFFSADQSRIPLKVGDEIVSVNGVSVIEKARERMKFVQTGTFAARLNGALESVLNVSHRYFPAEKTGNPVTLRMRRTENGKVQEWEVLARWSEKSSLAEAKLMAKTLGLKETPVEEKFQFGEYGLKKSYFSEGLNATFPEKGKVRDITAIIEWAMKRGGVTQFESAPVHLVRHGDKTVGVLRITQYSDKDSGLEKFLVLAARVLEKYADVVVLDHLNNSGGSNWMSTVVLRLFAGQSDIKTFLNEFKISRRALKNFKENFMFDPGDMVNPSLNFAEFEVQQKILRDLEQKLAEGDTWSGPRAVHSTHGLNQANEFGRVTGLPGDRSITKPLIILNDGRSASNGDMVPAILAANGRAKIIGEYSQGLGGFVNGYIPNTEGSDLGSRSTTAVCLPSNLLPVENVGAIPNIKRSVTNADLYDGFTTYSRQVLDAALLHLRGASDAEIQATVHSHLTPPSPALQSAQAIIHGLKSALESGISKRESLAAYRRASAEIATLHLADSEMVRVELPLPPSLYKRDFILASLTTKDAVIYRLRQMQKLPRYAAEKDYLESLAQAFETLGPVAIEDQIRSVSYFASPAEFFDELKK